MISFIKKLPNARRLPFKIASLTIILMLGGYLRYKFMVGAFLCEDDFHYTKRAIELLNWKINFENLSFSDYRFLIYAPQSIIHYFFDYSPLSIVLWPFLLSISHIYLVYKIAILLYQKEETALISAGIIAVSPLNVLEIRLYPDSVFAFFISLSIYYLLASHYVQSDKSTVKYILLSCVSLSVTFLVRENAFLVFPFVIVFVSFYVEKKKIYIQFYMLFILLLTILMACLSFTPINPIDKFLKMHDIFNTVDWNRAVSQIKRLPYLKYLQRPVVLGYGVATLFTFGSIYLMRFKEKSTSLLFLWFATLYGYFEFISPFHHLRPAEGSFRYFTPFMAPVALVTGRFLSKWIYQGKAVQSNLELILSVLVIAFAFFLQMKYENWLFLFPIIVFCLYEKLFRGKKRQSNASIECETINIIGIVILSLSVAVSLFYTYAASHGYNRLTLNHIVQQIHYDLKKQEPGLILCNNFLVERKVNLFSNKILIDRERMDATEARYVVIINEDISRKSYKWEHFNTNIYNKKLVNDIKKLSFSIIENNRNYKIFARL